MWYAVYTRARHEKKVFERMQEANIEAYLPIVKKLRQWKDRKKWIEVPLFNNYIFVNIESKQFIQVLQIQGVSRFVSSAQKPIQIPDWQIDNLKKSLEISEEPETAEYFVSGEFVEVTDGPFRGVKGYVYDRKKKNRIALSIEGIYQSVIIEVHPNWLKKISIPTE
ncbi:MAG: UpxY family transcription antiterminator [Calditrichia bacterium]